MMLSELEYYKTKSMLLEIEMQQGQLQEQIRELQKRKETRFKELGLTSLGIIFNDAEFEIRDVNENKSNEAGGSNGITGDT